MHVVIVGGRGFVGTHMSRVFLHEGHSVAVVSRSADRGELPQEVKYVSGDTTDPGAWQEEIRGAQAVINLAGASIFQRWNDRTRGLIRDSRLITTRNIAASMEEGVLCSASAVGYYGFHEDETLTEADPPGEDFLARLCRDWEAEAVEARKKNIRVVLTRFGIVLGGSGGALSKMAPIFKMGLGGPLGDGRQWFSWIHLEDLARAVLFLVNHPELEGPFNLCSPNPARNKEFSRILGRALHRPAIMPVPGFMIRLVMGEFGSVVLKGQRVIPKNLEDRGFRFAYPELEPALAEALDRRSSTA
jgi:uncharacterized protein (TIGR01777 family)